MGETTSDEIDPIRVAQAGDSRTTLTRTFLTTATLTSVRAIRVITTPSQILIGATRIDVTTAVTLLEDEAEVPTSETRAEGEVSKSTF
jgi:hypothetical protein